MLVFLVYIITELLYFPRNFVCLIFNIFKYGSKNHNYFLSTLRSGTNLTLACISVILKRPIAEANGMYHANNNTRLNIEYDSLRPIIRREHNPLKFWFVRKKHNRLVFLTRNPKELLFKQFRVQSVDDLKSISVRLFFKYYIGNFYYFEKWDEGNRMSIFYEDVIDDLENNLLNILEFIKEEPTYINNFVLNKEEMLNNIRESYVKDQKGHGGSSVGGAKKNFYTADRDPSLLKAVDEMLRKKDPYIYDKYLKRFES